MTKMTQNERAVFTRVMRQLGARGGRTTAQRMTPAQRRERASKAAQARYGKAAD